MTKIGAAQFKERCLALLDHLDPEGIVITKHGKPVARLVPWDRDSAELIGCLKDQLRVKGDTLSTGAEWDAES